MFCGECGAQNREGRKFCTACGAALDVNCAQCGAVLEPDDSFCGECGTPVGEASPRPPVSASAQAPVAAAPIAERRVVSVLFVDLVGFTTYSEGRDPEEVRGLLSDYFHQAEEIIGLHGGVVEKFIGDAVMAVWGTPVAQEDDAARAVRTALEIVDGVAALGTKLGTNLAARAGIYTGEASVNLAARGQGMVAGDMVNTASRLQSIAQPGTILVDRATYQGARGVIAFDSLGEVTLKGKDQAVEVWRPKRVIAASDGQIDPLEPAFTGRDEEFRLIKDLLHATARESKPHLASIMGIGGIGKSRLIRELLKYVDGLSDTLWWHQGRSPSYGEGVAFWALAEMVRMRARIAETDGDEDAAQKLDECLADWVPDETERKWLRPHLTHLIGLEQVSDVGHEQLFAAWRTFFERIGDRGTTILIFEDLHWADPGLIDFVEHLVEWARESPLAIITLARPELMERRPTWGAGQRRFSSIHLEPLPEDDMRLLLKSVASELPGQTADAIVARAEGIPLYAVEMVRMLIDQGDLVPDGDGYRWAGQSGSVNVPESLHSLIASRLDALGLEDRLLVQDASVLGKTFTTPSLGAVSAHSSQELEDRLRDLARREIFIVDTDPRSPERGQYGFVQSLIREVAYQTLSNKDRKARHLRAARYFESLDEADLIDVVATHFVEAYRNSSGDDDAAEIGQRARTSLEEAAGRASSLGSHEQAMVLLEKALTIAEGPAEQGRLRCKAGIAASISANTQSAVTHLIAAIDLLREAGDAELRARAQAQLGTAYFLLSKLDEAEEMLGEAIEELEDLSTGPAATILVEAARIQAFKGNFEDCDRFSALAMPAAERAERLDLIADALITRSVGAILSGRPHEAHALLSGALKLAEDNGLAAQQMRALLNIGANQLSIHPRLSFATAERAIEIARRFGSREQEAFALGNAIEAAMHLGDWEYCRSVMATADDFAAGSGAFLILNPAAAMAEAYAGDLETARMYADRYAEAIAGTTSVQDIAYLTNARCAIALVEGDPSTVLKIGLHESSDEAYELVSPHAVTGRAGLWARDIAAVERDLERRERSSVRTPWHECATRTIEAGLAALRGYEADASALYDRVLKEWDGLDIPLGRAMCQMDRALLLGDPTAATDAEAFFTAAGNEHLLRRLRDSRRGGADQE